MTYLDPDDDDFFRAADDESCFETPCHRCDRPTIGETCGGCGVPLCPMCFETSGGYHCAPRLRERA